MVATGRSGDCPVAVVIFEEHAAVETIRGGSRRRALKGDAVRLTTTPLPPPLRAGGAGGAVATSVATKTRNDCAASGPI